MKFLYTFGLNEDGQCGQREHKDKVLFPTLIKMSPFVEFVAISGGSRHTLALTANGEVYSWGWGHVGQLGHGDMQNCSFPHRIESLSRIKSISAGGMHSACIDEDGLCYTWGSNTYGQLGIGKNIYPDNSHVSLAHNYRTQNHAHPHPPHHLQQQQHHQLARCTPQLVMVARNEGDDLPPTPLCLQRVACGGMHTAAIDPNGNLYCWGKADNGQIGFSEWYLDFSPAVFSPKKVSGLPSKATNISCGGFFTLVLTEKGKVYAMGKEDFGCFGSNSDINNMSIGTEKPTLVVGLQRKTVRAIHAAGWHSLFITEDNRLFVTGKGEYGRLGLGDETSRMAPVLLAEHVQQAKGGGAHSIWCDSKNQIFTVGRLDGGRCGVGSIPGDRIRTARNITAHFLPGFTSIVQIEAGGSHSAVLLDYPEITSIEQVPSFFAEFDSLKAAMSTSVSV